MPTDTEIQQREGVGDQVINFRPSSNFCNMRFWKKKIVDAANESPEKEQSVTSPSYEKKEDVKPVQPPLPSYPPPPDSPPSLKTTVKKEIEDNDYQNTSDLEQSGLDIHSEENNAPQPEPTLNTQKPKKLICKDFIRGTCTRKLCKYAHELDLSQLQGIFTFCWNYQNTVCTKPDCKYVHANIFEEAQFYRTGVLPPHALNHQRKVNLLQPPPPPPEETQPQVAPSFSKPPPPLYNSVEKVIPMSSQTKEFQTTETPPIIAPLKKGWPSHDSVNSPPSADASDRLSNKCKNCVDMEFRLQYNKGKVEKMIRSSEEINDKMAQLDKKIGKLYMVMVSLLPNAKPNPNGLSSSLLPSDKEKSILEQLSKLMAEQNGSR